MLTHDSLRANLEQMQQHPGLRVLSSDVVLAVLPWFHVFGLNVVLNLALSAGAVARLALSAGRDTRTRPQRRRHRYRGGAGGVCGVGGVGGRAPERFAIRT